MFGSSRSAISIFRSRACPPRPISRSSRAISRTPQSTITISASRLSARYCSQAEPSRKSSATMAGGLGSDNKMLPFPRLAVECLQKLYPPELADKSWDNTGLLLEAPPTLNSKNLKNTVLLTIDLTSRVADEAIETNSHLVVAYHPIIFKKLSRLTLDDPQQASLLRLAAAGISVYCPHTAVDAANKGLGEWLADIVTANLDVTKRPIKEYSHAAELSTKQSSKWTVHAPSTRAMNTCSLALSASPLGDDAGLAHARTPIIANEVDRILGMGRLVLLFDPVPLTDLIEKIWLGLGQPGALPVALPQKLLPIEPEIHNQTSKQTSKIEPKVVISRISVCAGSGSSVFSSRPSFAPTINSNQDVFETELLFTGEMSHHDALAATESGAVVIAPGHSVTERAYLHQVMKPDLERLLIKKMAETPTEVHSAGPVNVFVSQYDRDPFSMAIRTGPTA